MGSLVITWILSRLTEPSTWAGTGVVAMAIYQYFPGALGDSIVAVVTAVAGLVAVILSEKAKPPTE